MVCGSIGHLSDFYNSTSSKFTQFSSVIVPVVAVETVVLVVAVVTVVTEVTVSSGVVENQLILKGALYISSHLVGISIEVIYQHTNQ